MVKIGIIMVCFIIVSSVFPLDSLEVLGTRSLQKLYPSRGLKLNIYGNHNQKYIAAVNDINLNFTQPITTFVGTSGSGKSTISKLICGIELPSTGKILRNQDNANNLNENKVYCGGYIDQHYYMTYDGKKRVSHLLSYTDHRKVLLEIINQTQLPDIQVDNLLSSQRRAFDILLVLSRMDSISQFVPLVILDEYLDKDMISTLTTFKKFLLHLSKEIDLQVFIVTHSKSALSVFHDDVIAMNAGRVFSRAIGRRLDSLNLPAQLQMI